MATVHKGGRNKDEARARYPGGQPKPIDNDFGPTEQRLKREVASGNRTASEAETLSAIFAKLGKANISQEAIRGSKVQSVVLKGGILDQDELSQAIAFSDSPPPRRGFSAMDVLLARGIIEDEQFKSGQDFVACWCAYIGKPWPRGWSAERQSPDFNGGMSEAALKQMKVRYWNSLAALDAADKTIYPVVSDIVVHGKMLGLVEDILNLDIVRIDGVLVTRSGRPITPSIRSRIGRLTRGLQLLENIAYGDYSREAEALLSAIRSRDPVAASFTRHSDSGK